MSELSPPGGSEGYGACDDEAASSPIFGRSKMGPRPPSFVPRKTRKVVAAIYGGPTYTPPTGAKFLTPHS